MFLYHFNHFIVVCHLKVRWVLITFLGRALTSLSQARTIKCSSAIKMMSNHVLSLHIVYRHTYLNLCIYSIYIFPCVQTFDWYCTHTHTQTHTHTRTDKHANTHTYTYRYTHRYTSKTQVGKVSCGPIELNVSKLLTGTVYGKCSTLCVIFGHNMINFNMLQVSHTHTVGG